MDVVNNSCSLSVDQSILTAKTIDRAMVTEIYHALEVNNDLPRSWVDVKHTVFKKVFGPKKQ